MYHNMSPPVTLLGLVFSYVFLSSKVLYTKNVKLTKKKKRGCKKKFLVVYPILIIEPTGSH